MHIRTSSFQYDVRYLWSIDQPVFLNQRYYILLWADMLCCMLDRTTVQILYLLIFTLQTLSSSITMLSCLHTLTELQCEKAGTLRQHLPCRLGEPSSVFLDSWPGNVIEISGWHYRRVEPIKTMSSINDFHPHLNLVYPNVPLKTWTVIKKFLS